MRSELDEFIERVNERTDIYSVVSRYVSLTQKSGRYWGCCPFHNEKTPSFCVSSDKGFFYCFGCGAGGNAFKFLSLIENISYFEAIKLQAQRLGIDLPERKYSPEEEHRRREEKTLLQINATAQDFYHECLIKTPHGEVGRKYLAARGITMETIETFKLGYAPDDWEVLLTKLTKQGFSPQNMEAVGLVTKRKNSSSYYDRFRGRVMIPITDVFGHVVGFGGRILNSEDENNPKYLNTPETALFRKGKLLFGLDRANRAINAASAAIVVEGYMDAISLFSAGIKNVVATLGTAFTHEHAKLILRYARKIVFCYDSDEAGQRATIRALPIVQAAGAEVFVVKVPDGKDPDEFVRKHGKAAFEELIKDAVSLVDYRMKYVLERAELSTIEGKAKALQEILPVLSKINNKTLRNEYRRKLAVTLLLDERVIADEWRRLAAQSRWSENREQAKTNQVKDNVSLLVKGAAEEVLRKVWQDTDILEYVLAILPQEIFPTIHQEIIEWLKVCTAEERRPDEFSAAKELSNEANTELARILMKDEPVPVGKEIDRFNDAVKSLKRVVLWKKYCELLAQADKYNANDKAAYVKAVEESLKIKREIDKLKGNH